MLNFENPPINEIEEYCFEWRVKARKMTFPAVVSYTKRLPVVVSRSIANPEFGPFTEMSFHGSRSQSS
jgi:hypothetical protein